MNTRKLILTILLLTSLLRSMANAGSMTATESKVPSQEGALLLDEAFDTDVFAGGGWTRTDPSVSVDTANGWLHIHSNGVYGDYAEIALPVTLPIKIEYRSRLVSGGFDYRLPALHVIPTDPAKTIIIGYGSDTSMGWFMNIWPNWSGVHTQAPPSENVWMTVKAIIHADGGELWAKYDGDPDYTFIISSSWSIPGQVTHLRIYQPWDSINDIDYISVSQESDSLFNLALQSNGGVATASSYGCYAGYCATADQANDGKAYPNVLENSFWAAPAWQLPAWIKVRLATDSVISKIVVRPVNRQMTYLIEGSPDNANWTVLVPVGTYPGDRASTFYIDEAYVQYVRLTVTGSDAPGTFAWATEISELEIYGFPTASPATRLTAGGRHACTRNDQGSERCWGWNQWGQLGDGTNVNRSQPVDVIGVSGAQERSAGWGHTCAISSGGLQCWGWNQNGILGDGSTSDRYSPVQVVGLTSGVAAVANGGYHTCALTITGGVKCWGGNWYGQLGDGTTEARHTPVDVAGLTSGVIGITAGKWHTCALTAKREVKCWGYNGSGQLGDGSTTDSPAPVNVSSLGSGVLAITAGGTHTCALVTDGVKCWGNNTGGQLGDGSFTDRTTPVEVVGLPPDIEEISAGGAHTCALTHNHWSGGVKCWGANWDGQLGDGSNDSRSTPVDVVGLSSGAGAIAAGEQFTCARLPWNGTRCWGENAYGQLGDGSLLGSNLPVTVADWDTRFIDLSISLYKTASTEERLAYQAILGYFADSIFELSNGTQKIRNVTIFQNGEQPITSNIIWNNSEWPRAHVAGYGHYDSHVWMGDYFAFPTPYHALDMNHWRGAGYTLGHEWGHYYYGLRDEYRILEGDIPVEPSAMNSQWRALGGDYAWLNFSVPMDTLNGQGKTAQDRQYAASGWETLARPVLQDPRSGQLNAFITREYYPELVNVAPGAGQDPTIELDTTPTGVTRSHLQITWVAPNVATQSPQATVFSASVVSLTGAEIAYPQPVVLVASIRGNDPIARAGVNARGQTPNGTYFDLTLKDDGLAPDLRPDDGLYTDLMPYQMAGEYTITVTFDNNLGIAAYSQAAADHAISPDGDRYTHTMIPVGEPFSQSASTSVTILNYAGDDHADSPLGATSLAPNNIEIPGRLDGPTDRDVFQVIPPQSGTMVVRLSQLAPGMNPTIRILAANGVTLISEYQFHPQGSQYFYAFLDVLAGESLYVEVSDSNPTLGYYAISAGRALSGVTETQKHIYMPLIVR